VKADRAIVRKYLPIKEIVRAAILTVPIVVAGCSPLGLRAGISPTLNAASVTQSSNDRQLVMAALQADAGFGSAITPGWFEVTLAGLNYVDDQCMIYFDQLFKLNRRRDAIKSALSSFDQTTAAILHATGATALTMNIVAQVFGLGSRITDVVAGTYLYQLPPATTLRFVEETLHAYKIKVNSERGQINSAAAAYSYIRGYLNLCLPATIEGSLVNHVGGAKAVARNDGAGSIAVQVTTDNSALVLSTMLENSQASVMGVGDQGTRVGLNSYERDQVTSSHWRSVQRTLCIPIDGVPGKATHQAIADYFEGRGQPSPDLLVTGIGPGEMAILNQSVSEANGRTCEELGYENAREVGAASG
jgi:hypothetical protein